MKVCFSLSYDHYDALLSTSDDPTIHLAYAVILGQAEAMTWIEAVYGTGNLLKLDHSVVRDLIGNGGPWEPAAVSQAEIEAAKAYRAGVEAVAH